MGRIRKRLVRLALACACASTLSGALLAHVISVSGGASAARPTEYEVKAAFLYNFAKFTQWPGSCFIDSGTPLIIGVYGADPFGSALEAAVANRTICGRAVGIRRFRPGDPLRCHMLFVPAAERSRLPQLLAALKDSAILVVSDEVVSGSRRPMISFRMVESQVRFEVSLREVEEAHLVLSSQLIRLAINVRSESVRR